MKNSNRRLSITACIWFGLSAPPNAFGSSDTRKPLGVIAGGMIRYGGNEYELVVLEEYR